MKLIYIYIAIWTTLCLSSCSDILDTAPTDAVVDTEIYKSTDNIQTVIEGTWQYLNDTYFTYANPGYTAFMRTSDAMGNDVAVTTKYGYRDPYTFNEMINPSAYRVTSLWTLLYKVIDNTNNVIHKVDAAEGSEQDKNILKGQAKALRAFCYLNLASFYQFSYQKDKNALTAPIYTEPTTRETKGQPKASLEAIYDVILNDLHDASVLLEDYGRNSKYKIDEQVVQGLLARVYLNMGLWTDAAEAAEKAKDGYDFMTPDAYEQGFNDIENTEWIWGHIQTSEQNAASYTFHYLDVSSPGSYYFSFMADPYFKDLFDPQDIRYTLFEWDGEPGREGFLRYKKFKFKSNLIGDIVYMRAAEMWLIAAEGYARAGQTAKAIEALNTLRTARNAPLYSTASGKLLDEILIERRKELWGEGFSLSDIIRTQTSVSRKAFLNNDGTPIQVKVTTPDGTLKTVNGQGHRVVNFPDGKEFTANSRYYIFAIPSDEVRRNPNLNKND